MHSHTVGGRVAALATGRLGVNIFLRLSQAERLAQIFRSLRRSFGLGTRVLLGRHIRRTRHHGAIERHRSQEDENSGQETPATQSHAYPLWQHAQNWTRRFAKAETSTRES